MRTRLVWSTGNEQDVVTNPFWGRLAEWWYGLPADEQAVALHQLKRHAASRQDDEYDMLGVNFYTADGDLRVGVRDDDELFAVLSSWPGIEAIRRV